MKTSLVFLLLALAVASAHSVKGKGKHPKAKSHVSAFYSLDIAPWLKTPEEKERERQSQAISPGAVEGGQRRVLFMVGAAYTLLTKASQVVDTVSSYKSRFNFLVGLVRTASSGPTTADIEGLKKQLKAMNSYMKSSFSQVLAGQDYGHVVLNYNRYVHHLQSVAMLDVFEHIDEEGQMSQELTEEVVDDIIGGKNADKTEFALLKVNEMLSGGSIVGLGSLYPTIAKKNAACVPDGCKTGLQDLPVLATSFNTLQAAAYGALETAFKKRGLESKATKLSEKLAERMEEQVKMLVTAQTEYKDAAGSGPALLRLRSARGGCLAFDAVDNVKFHLRDCDDDNLLKVRLDKNGVIYNREDTSSCINVYFGGFVDSTVCPNNRWTVDIHKKDPRYFRLSPESERRGRCLAGNYGDERGGYPAVGKDYSCASLDDDSVLTTEQGNHFWEFLPDPTSN